MLRMLVANPYDNISEKAHDFNRGMKALNDFSDSQYI